MVDKIFYIAVKAAIYHYGKILIVRRSSEARGDYGTWELPGGRLEFGESPEDALHRELREEVGMDVSVIKLISTWTFLKDEDTQLVGITYLCYPLEEEQEVTLSHEHTDFDWLTDNGTKDYDFSVGVEEEIRSWDWDSFTVE